LPPQSNAGLLHTETCLRGEEAAYRAGAYIVRTTDSDFVNNTELFVAKDRSVQ